MQHQGSTQHQDAGSETDTDAQMREGAADAASASFAAAAAAALDTAAPLPAMLTDHAGEGRSNSTSVTAPLAFGSFLSTVRRSGLRLLRTLDAPTLLRFAEQSLVLEEEVATGCIMIQGIALLEHFDKTHGICPLDWPEQATRTVRDFYKQRSAGLEVDTAGGMDRAVAQPSAAAAAAAAAPATGAVVSHRDATWRAGFSLRVYEVMLRQPKDYAVLEPLLLQTSISILQLLVQRFWFKRNLGLLAKLLQHVIQHRIGKATVAECISQWKREDMERDMNDSEQDAIVATFRQNIDALRSERECKEKKRTSRKRIAEQVEAAEQAAGSTSSSVVMPISSHTIPTFLPFFGRFLSQYPEALCPVDLPLELAFPQRRHAVSPPLQPPIAMPAAAVSSPSSTNTQHAGLDTVVQAVTASEIGNDGGTVPAAAAAAVASPSLPKRMRHATRSVAPHSESANAAAEAEDNAVETEQARPSSRRKRRKVMIAVQPKEVAAAEPEVVAALIPSIEDVSASDSPSAPKAESEAEAARPQPPTVSWLRAPMLIPVELLSLGVSAWMRKRVASTTDAAHRDAMDHALSDLMWELGDQLTDGERLQLPEFAQARRSASRAASATHNARMEGERHGTIVLRMLETLGQATQSPPPCEVIEATLSDSLQQTQLHAAAEAMTACMTSHESNCDGTSGAKQLLSFVAAQALLSTDDERRQAHVAAAAAIKDSHD